MQLFSFPEPAAFSHSHFPKKNSLAKAALQSLGRRVRISHTTHPNNCPPVSIKLRFPDPLGEIISKALQVTVPMSIVQPIKRAVGCSSSFLTEPVKQQQQICTLLPGWSVSIPQMSDRSHCLLTNSTTSRQRGQEVKPPPIA